MSTLHWSHKLALIGSNAFGLMVAGQALVDVVHHRLFEIDSSNVLAAVGVVFGIVVLPIVTTCLVPRKSFLWAAGTLGVGLGWTVLAHLITFRQPATDSRLRNDLLVNAFVLLVFCGPISLLRLSVRRSRDRKARRAAEQLARIQQASEAVAGVWPPPIKKN